MLVHEAFERDPKRRIEPVVSVVQHAPDVVYTELDEYIVTDEIHRAVRDLLDRPGHGAAHDHAGRVSADGR